MGNYGRLNVAKNKLMLGLNRQILRHCVGLITGHCSIRFRIKADYCTVSSEEEEILAIWNILTY